MNEMHKKLYRSRTDRIFAGVCGGLAEYFHIDPLIVRLIFIFLTIGHGAGLLIYILMAIFVPRESGDAAPINHGEKVKEFVQETKERASELLNRHAPHVHESFGHGRALGILILVVGIILLLNQFLPFYWLDRSFVWPVIIIVIGIVVLTRHNHN